MYITIIVGKAPIMCVFAYVPECSGCNVVIVMYMTMYIHRDLCIQIVVKVGETIHNMMWVERLLYKQIAFK